MLSSLLLTLLLSYISLAFPASVPYKAIVIKPVIDLLGDYIPTNASSIYDTLGYAGASNNAACKRVHQLLFGQIVTVLQETHDQVKIEVPSVYYVVGDKPDKHITFWTQKEGILSIESLPLHTRTLLEGTPRSYFFSLKKPLYVSALRATLSAGTRFYIKELLPQHKISVYVFHAACQSIKEIIFNRSDGILARSHSTYPPADYRSALVNLLREWAEMHNGFIPYVWGGCSYTTRLNDGEFTRKNTASAGEEVYDWPSFSATPKTGFDCSGIILQAATMLGFPYYFKNSHTVMKCLAEVTADESIKKGDIIWIPRHVMVVADADNATIIEARSYGHGFGKVQELPLSHVFQGIHTFKELQEAIIKQKPLQRLDAQQQPVQEITHVKILNLDTLWPAATQTATAHKKRTQ